MNEQLEQPQLQQAKAEKEAARKAPLVKVTKPPVQTMATYRPDLVKLDLKAPVEQIFERDAEALDKTIANRPVVSKELFRRSSTPPGPNTGATSVPMYTRDSQLDRKMAGRDQRR